MKTYHNSPPFPPKKIYSKLLKLQGLEDDVVGLPPTFPRWWFQFFYFHPYLGKISYLTNTFQRGWFNHQPVPKKNIMTLQTFFWEKNASQTTEDVALATQYGFVAWMCLKLFCCFKLVCLCEIGTKKPWFTVAIHNLFIFFWRFSGRAQVEDLVGKIFGIHGFFTW